MNLHLSIRPQILVLGNIKNIKYLITKASIKKPIKTLHKAWLI